MTKTSRKRLRAQVAWDGKKRLIWVGDLDYKVRCWFRMRSGTTGLFADKIRCLLCGEDICVLCDSDEVEDVLHFLALCDEFQWERQDLLRMKEIESSDMF